MRTNKAFLKCAGIFFILTGLFLNEWVLAILLTADNSIASKAARGVIWLFDIAAVFSGIMLIFFTDTVKKHIRKITVFF